MIKEQLQAMEEQAALMNKLLQEKEESRSRSRSRKPHFDCRESDDLAPRALGGAQTDRTSMNPESLMKQ